ncbi:MAG: beta-ketoacyl-[acyl-carrier-protein] synthase family protein [Candidatus Omnitrophota bacterium]
MTKRRVVVTGMGLVTPCGQGWQPYWEAVLQAQSSIRYFSNLHLNGFSAKIAGEIPDFNPEKFVKIRKTLKVMSREIQLAIAASQLAVQDAGIALESEDLQRFGLSLGTGIINNDLDEMGIGIRTAVGEAGTFEMSKFGQEGIRSLFPLWLLKYLPNMPACHISILHGLRGPSNTITTSASAGTQAVGEAARVIERGDADVMLAGGTDSKLNAMGISRFHLLNLLSHQNHVPESAYCPFDIRHDGIVLGEGAGLLVIEELEHARARHANIYAEISGYGSSSDFNHDPRCGEDSHGKSAAMQAALSDAGTGPDAVGLIVANGSGIPQEDIQEACAIRGIFEKVLDSVKVTGVKPITGHLVYGSGGVELAAAVLAVHKKVVPPLANLEVPDPECELPFAVGKAQPRELKNVLFNSFGFGGQNACLVVSSL